MGSASGKRRQDRPRVRPRGVAAGRRGWVGRLQLDTQARARRRVDLQAEDMLWADSCGFGSDTDVPSVGVIDSVEALLIAVWAGPREPMGVRAVPGASRGRGHSDITTLDLKGRAGSGPQKRTGAMPGTLHRSCDYRWRTSDTSL